MPRARGAEGSGCRGVQAQRQPHQALEVLAASGLSSRNWLMQYRLYAPACASPTDPAGGTRLLAQPPPAGHRRPRRDRNLQAFAARDLSSRNWLMQYQLYAPACASPTDPAGPTHARVRLSHGSCRTHPRPRAPLPRILPDPPTPASPPPADSAGPRPSSRPKGPAWRSARAEPHGSPSPGSDPGGRSGPRRSGGRSAAGSRDFD